MNEILAGKACLRKSEVPLRKMLIVTSCTKDKQLSSNLPDHCPLLADQLWDERDDDRIERDFGVLEKYRIPAVQLYQGLQHRKLMQGVELLRQAFGVESIDVKIISAGFGVVSEQQLLPPYEATFANLPSSKILAISQRLQIPQKINELLTKTSYDCAFFLLGENYLLSLGLPFVSEPVFPCLFLASPANQKIVLKGGMFHLVPTGKDDSVTFSCNLIGLKGHLFKLFAEQIINPHFHTPLTVLRRDVSAYERLESFFATPTAEHFLSIINPLRRSHAVSSQPTEKISQMSLFINTQVPDKKARNYGRPLRYFIPDWDDLVDPGYDFENDSPTLGRRKYYDEVYAHQIYRNANYDGLLFSRSTIEHSPKKSQLIREMGGIHAFARFEKGPILGDCGAFSYITEKDPSYDTRSTLDYYQQYGFDYGVSVDHLIVPAFEAEKEYRYQLTQENAREFMKFYREGNYTFTPIGVAQGWSPETYKQAAERLLEEDYKYIALGGLTRTPTEKIIKVVQAIAPILQEDTDLHLFGVARDRENDEMEQLRKLGVTSFDSASYLRRAWMSATHNYFTEDGKRYSALRIPPIYSTNAWVKKIIADGLATFEELQKLEKDALQAVRAYSKGQLALEAALNVLLEIDKVEGYNYDQHKEAYRSVLEDQPWKKCSCEICRDLGIEVMIFRGNDRNRRRGFHNTYVFYQRLSQLLKLHSI